MIRYDPIKLQESDIFHTLSYKNLITDLYLGNTIVLVLHDQFVLGVPKMYLTLTLNFGAVTTFMSRILFFPIFLDLYNSFDTLFICFHGLMNKWQ